MQVADFMSDTELEALASIVAERVAAHVPSTATAKPLSRSLGKLMSSFKDAIGVRRKPAWSSERKASSSSMPPPIDTSEELLRAIELLPEHLISLILEPYDMHAILRIPTTTPRPKLLLALQQPTRPSPPCSSLPSAADDTDTPSDTPSPSAPDPTTPPAASQHSHELHQDFRSLPFAHIGSHAAAYLAIQLPALHAHLTPNNSPLAAPQTLLSLDLSHNNLASRNPQATTSFKTPLDALAAHLSSLTALRALNISFNSIAATQSIARLATAMRHLEWLQELNISHNLIDSAGAVKLAACLPAVTALASLDIRANQIGTLGARAISSALFLPAEQLQRHPSHRAIPRSSSSPQPSPSPTPPPATAAPIDPDMLPESPTTPNSGSPKSDEFLGGDARSESPMELLDLSHNDVEPPGLLEVAVTFAQAGGRACHLSHLDLSYNCRAAHDRLVRSLKGSGSFSPREAAYARAYARVPAADGLSLLPAGVLADGSVYEGTAGIDMLEALIAMAPFLVAENLPALRTLRVCAYVARNDADGAAEDSIIGINQFQRERTAEARPGPAPRWGAAAVNGQQGATTPAPRTGAAPQLGRSGSRREDVGHAADAARAGEGGGGGGDALGCVRDPQGMEVLGESLATFAATLRRVDMRGLPLFAGEGARGIASGLGALTQLTALDLSATDAGAALCGGGGLVAFSQLTGGDAAHAGGLGPGTAFLTRMSALKRLDLSECGIDGDRIEPEVLEGFARHLCALGELEELSLAGNGLKGGLVVIMPHLGTLPGLRGLSVADNRISPVHFAGMADGLAQLDGLTRLDLSDNRIGGSRRKGDSAMGLVTECLRQLTALQELHMSYNRLRHAEAEVLLPCLQAMAALRRVFLKQHERLEAAEARAYLAEMDEWVV